MATTDRQDVPVYPIRTVARLTGVSDKALRAWEGRYGLITPARTSGGHRLFSKSDILRIKEIKKMLREDGMSMSGVRRLLEGKAGD